MLTTSIRHTKEGIALASVKLLEEAERLSDCPLTQYAHIVSLRRACEEALKALDADGHTLQDRAVLEAQAEYPHAESQQFEHEGLMFQFKRSDTYDFSESNGWIVKAAQVEKANDVLKMRRKSLRAFETDYLARHPELKPVEIDLSVSFIPQ